MGEPTRNNVHEGTYRVGVDIGGTKIEAVLVDAAGSVAASHRVPARRGAGNVVEDVTALVRTVAGEHLGELAGVGIGTPGQVDSEAGTVSHVVNLDIDTLALGPEVGERLGGIPVRVENDVNAAALGAAQLVPGARGEGTVVFLNFGTGLAAGVIVDGVLQHGFSGAAGEVGHIPIDPNRFACPCGQRGCLETVCSGASVQRLWPADGRPAMPDLIERAHCEQADAVRVLGIVSHAMGDALQIVGQAFDPRVIIVGGGMAKTGEPLLDVMSDELFRREADCPFLKGLHLADRLRLAPVDQPIGALGAALAV
ncbi:ROK family protein [Bifidobacterium callitrichidarum]|uniref:NagC family transcriptional regulator n=1 Tax=Bifidobacterium callitrichidarum TaxID=2052941 RepID=A0A2U2N3H9_9BIFI|nr:ROK family protein [Bifidobacterium callitrichidarum]PWG63617.1 NagC family transcriptional regulator [Bifidobacterium callitrichidarum]